MCLITEMQKPLIAEKDIKAYKVLNSDRSSVMFNKKYTEDKLYKTAMKTSKNWSTFDNEDGEYYEEKYPNFQTGEYKELKCIAEGFHGAFTKKRLQLFKSDNQIIVSITYPKGCKYYIDATGLIVGNQIIVH